MCPLFFIIFIYNVILFYLFCNFYFSSFFVIIFYTTTGIGKKENRKQLNLLLTLNFTMIQIQKKSHTHKYLHIQSYIYSHIYTSHVFINMHAPKSSLYSIQPKK